MRPRFYGLNRLESASIMNAVLLISSEKFSIKMPGSRGLGRFGGPRDTTSRHHYSLFRYSNWLLMWLKLIGYLVSVSKIIRKFGLPLPPSRCRSVLVYLGSRLALST